MRGPTPTVLHAKGLAEGTNSSGTHMGHIHLFSQQIFMEGCYLLCNTPDTYKDHLNKCQLSRDQCTMVLKEVDLKLRV